MRIPSLLLALAATATTLSAAKPLETYLPTGTVLYASLADINSKAAEECGPLNEIVKNEKICAFFKPVRDAFENLIQKDESLPDLKWEDIRQKLDGQIVIGISPVTALASALRDEANPPAPEFELLASSKDAKALAELLAGKAKERAAEKGTDTFFAGSETFLKCEIFDIYTHIEDEDDGDAEYDEEGNPIEKTAKDEETEPGKCKHSVHFYFGACKNVFFATTSMESAKALVEALKGEEKNTLAEEAQAEAARGMAEKNDFYLYLDFRPLARMVEDLIREKLTVKPGEQPNPSKPTPEALISALGLDSLRYAYYGLRFESDDMIASGFFSADSSHGLGRLILGSFGDHYPTPDFAPANVANVNSASFNLGTLLFDIRDMVFTASPALSVVYNMQIAQFQTQSGVNLETDLVGNIDSGLVSFVADTGASAVDPNTFQQVFAFKLKDGAAFKKAADILLAMTPAGAMFQRRDFNGVELMTMPLPTGGFSMAVKDGWMLFSPGQQAIQDALSVGPDTKSFWQTKASTNLGNGKLDDGGIGMTYGNGTSLVRFYLAAFANAYNMTAIDKGTPLDLTLIDAIGEVPVVLAGKSFKTADGIRSETHLLRKE
jgi:hypothetical protein